MALFYAAPSVKKHIDFSESECGTTQYGQQNIHSASMTSRQLYILWQHDRNFISRYVLKTRAFFSVKLPFANIQEKNESRTKYTLILQLAGGLSIQRFSILLAVISEPTLMKACHCRRLFVRMP